MIYKYRYIIYTFNILYKYKYKNIKSPYKDLY